MADLAFSLACLRDAQVDDGGVAALQGAGCAVPAEVA